MTQFYNRSTWKKYGNNPTVLILRTNKVFSYKEQQKECEAICPLASHSVTLRKPEGISSQQSSKKNIFSKEWSLLQGLDDLLNFFSYIP